jgi:hypothetical protein
MKNLISAVLLGACLALGLIVLKERSVLKKQSAQLDGVQKQLAEVQDELKQKQEAFQNAQLSEVKAKILQQTLTESTTNAAAQSQKTAQLEQSLAESKTNNPLHGMAAMFKDPKMREMMKSQQKAVMGTMVDKQYADFFKQANLTPDQTATLKNLIEQKMLAGADAGMQMMDDTLDASQRADLAKQIKDENQQFEDQIKQFLGDDNYQAYQSYEKTMTDRYSVSQFGDQLADTPTPLTTDEQQQLISAMSDVRNNFQWSTDLKPHGSQTDPNFASQLTDDNINKFAQDQERLDQLLLDRARQILSPEQLTAYQNFQSSQRQLQLMAMKMAAKMFGH